MSDKKDAPWRKAMPEKQFNFMRSILSAPSPIGLEGAMTYGVLKPFFEEIKLKDWGIQSFKGNAGLVLDTHPGEDERFSLMLIGHADKIRMQVRQIGEDGKIWINSDSFLPTTLIGHEVKLFSEDPKKPGNYRLIEGGTIEALGAIHFAPPELRAGKSGIRPEMLYLELQMYGENPKAQIEKLGIRAGDSIILDRPIRHGFSKHTFYGAYLDNGLGCFTAAEVARLVAKRGGTKNIRIQFAMASHEEIGRFGSRVLAGVLKPDALIAIDVNHDLKAAPGVADQRFTPLSMGEGFTMASGSITSEFLNAQLAIATLAKGIPSQRGVTGRDTGTDAMAGVLASIDTAATSVGFPIRNMHTISETAHTGDVLCCIHALDALIEHLDGMNKGKGIKADDLRKNHPRLDKVKSI
ncbi:MAG: putative aminopeptidase FrvX [Kiritimatiellia bacterium]|jgi:putative aminopeptidase FrvX